MARNGIIPVTVKDSIAMDIERVRQDIRARAYDRFVERGALTGHEVEDWLAAETEVLLFARDFLERDCMLSA